MSKSSDTTRDPSKSKQRLGCLIVAVVVAGLAVGGGMLISRCDDAKKSPCERYAETMARELNNCHSGVTRNHRHHIEVCERSVNATKACLKKIESLECPQLEANPIGAAGEVCQK